jgi:hypothetical protein
MALFNPPHIGVKSRVAQSPGAIQHYAAFEAAVRDQLVSWPTRSTELATGLIMSMWTRAAAKQGLIEIPPGRLHHIATLGSLCGWRMKPAEVVWAKELMNHLIARRTAAV